MAYLACTLRWPGEPDERRYDMREAGAGATPQLTMHANAAVKVDVAISPPLESTRNEKGGLNIKTQATATGYYRHRG